MKSLSLILFLSLSGLLLSQTRLTKDEMMQMRNLRKGIHPKAREISKDSLSKLKAVLIIGSGFDLTDNIPVYDSIEKRLNESGIKLTRVYPSIPLDSVYKKTKGANILIYVGHGMKNGGLAMSTHILQNDFKKLGLAKNHIVILQNACYSAGSSKGDTDRIGIEEAKKRVYNYSKGFVDNGASLYFATGSAKGVSNFLLLFLKGMSIEDITDAQLNPKIEISVVNEKIMNGKYDMVIKREYCLNHESYTYAYATLPSFKIYQLMK